MNYQKCAISKCHVIQAIFVIDGQYEYMKVLSYLLNVATSYTSLYKFQYCSTFCLLYQFCLYLIIFSYFSLQAARDSMVWNQLCQEVTNTKTNSEFLSLKKAYRKYGSYFRSFIDLKSFCLINAIYFRITCSQSLSVGKIRAVTFLSSVLLSTPHNS